MYSAVNYTANTVITNLLSSKHFVFHVLIITAAAASLCTTGLFYLLQIRLRNCHRNETEEVTKENLSTSHESTTYHSDGCPHAVSLFRQTRPVQPSYVSLTVHAHHRPRSSDDQVLSRRRGPMPLAACTLKPPDQNHTRTKRFVCPQCLLLNDCIENHKNSKH